MPSTLRFLREYLRPGRGTVVTQEIMYEREGTELPATVYRPARRGVLPGWVVLHGLTWSGREHPGLIRFVRSVAAAGNIVLVPDIPEWRALRVAPAVTVATIRAAVRTLLMRADLEHEHAGLFGFSFGATQSLVASTWPDVRDRLHGIAAWGGYADVFRLFRFGMVGEFELDGRHWSVRPDPYGCWIMAGNYFAHMPGYEECADVAGAVHQLALEAGRRRVFAWDPVFDADKRRLRETVAPARRELFDLLAPETGKPGPDPAVTGPLSQKLAEAALRVDPLFDPGPFLPKVEVPVLLAHGRSDRLIPWTETIRLARALPRERIVRATVTGLFEHSGGTTEGAGIVARMRENLRFAGLLGAVLRMPVR
jgi:dienelactone hydrolase